jgi:hypothetical protein
MLAVHKKLPEPLRSSFFSPGCLRAGILSSRASPNSSYARKAEKFLKLWKTSPTLCRPHEDDIRAHLLEQ